MCAVSRAKLMAGLLIRTEAPGNNRAGAQLGHRSSLTIKTSITERHIKHQQFQMGMLACSKSFDADARIACNCTVRCCCNTVAPRHGLNDLLFMRISSAALPCCSL